MNLENVLTKYRVFQKKLHHRGETKRMPTPKIGRWRTNSLHVCIVVFASVLLKMGVLRQGSKKKYSYMPQPLFLEYQIISIVPVYFHNLTSRYCGLKGSYSGGSKKNQKVNLQSFGTCSCLHWGQWAGFRCGDSRFHSSKWRKWIFKFWNWLVARKLILLHHSSHSCSPLWRYSWVYEN